MNGSAKLLQVLMGYVFPTTDKAHRQTWYRLKHIFTSHLFLNMILQQTSKEQYGITMVQVQKLRYNHIQKNLPQHHKCTFANAPLFKISLHYIVFCLSTKQSKHPQLCFTNGIQKTNSV